ncbi:MAG: hypothetical protein NZM11_00825 [Anaerolineales bacterium]|nr:hypothetical protein [Anaerolineales bacterium]
MKRVLQLYASEVADLLSNSSARHIVLMSIVVAFIGYQHGMVWLEFGKVFASLFALSFLLWDLAASVMYWAMDRLAPEEGAEQEGEAAADEKPSHSSGRPQQKTPHRIAD